MMSPKNQLEKNEVLAPVQAEIKNLLSMFDFFMSQRELGKSIEELNECVRDMRLIIGRLLMDHFIGLQRQAGERFCKAVAEMLTDHCADAAQKSPDNEKYCNYCVGEILTCFEYAMEIKREFADDPIFQKMLALDIPILRPFDYGLRGSFKIIGPQKNKKMHE